MTVLTGMLTFSIALAISFGLTPLLRRLALRLGMVDRPNARKLHRSPMPLLGGLAIYLGTLVGIMFSLDGQPRGQIFGILAGGELLLATGIFDDRGLLHHQFKLFVAMPLAAAPSTSATSAATAPSACAARRSSSGDPNRTSASRGREPAPRIRSESS